MNQERFDSAVALRDSGRNEQAALEFELMAADADDANEKAALLSNEMTCYCRLRRLEDADRILLRLRAIPLEDPRVRICVDFLDAGLAAQHEDLEKALSMYVRILEDYVGLLDDPEYRDLHEDIQQRRACISVRLHRYEEALPLLRRASSFDTLRVEDHQETHLFMGICYTQLGERDAAKRELLTAIEYRCANGSEAGARYRLALLCIEDCAFPQAKVQLETIIHDYANDVPDIPRPSVYEALSIVCGQLGEKEQAEQYLRMARESSV